MDASTNDYLETLLAIYLASQGRMCTKFVADSKTLNK